MSKITGFVSINFNFYHKIYLYYKYPFVMGVCLEKFLSPVKNTPIKIYTFGRTYLRPYIPDKLSQLFSYLHIIKHLLSVYYIKFYSIDDRSV